MDVNKTTMKNRFVTFITFSFCILITFDSISQGQIFPPKSKIEKDQIKLMPPVSISEIPPPPPPPPPVEDEVFMCGIREIYPRFPGCEELNLNKKELERCSKDSMLSYIYDNLKYQDEARAKGIKGMVVIQFVIDKEGKVDNIHLVRCIDEDCDQAAIDVVKKMQAEKIWIPGIQRNRISKVQYTLPIKFGY